MITIEYCEDGQPISDFSCSDWLYNVKQVTADHIFRVSTSLPIGFIRLAIVRGELDYNNVTFLYCGHPFQANRFGAILDWPTGFCDRYIAVCEDILRAAMKKKREERAANTIEMVQN